MSKDKRKSKIIMKNKEQDSKILWVAKKTAFTTKLEKIILYRKKVSCILCFCFLLTGCGLESANSDEVIATSNIDVISDKDANCGYGDREKKTEKSEDKIIFDNKLANYDLVPDDLYTNNSYLFEYQKKGLGTIRDINVEGSSPNIIMNSGLIFPEQFDDYDKDGKKDLIAINLTTDFLQFERIYPENNYTVHDPIEFGIYLAPCTDAELMWYILTDVENNKYMIRETKLKYYDVENDYKETVKIERSSNYTCLQAFSVTDLQEFKSKEVYIRQSYVNDSLEKATYSLAEDNVTILFSNDQEVIEENIVKYQNQKEAEQEIEKWVNSYKMQDNTSTIMSVAVLKYSLIEQEGEIEGNSRMQGAGVMEIACNNYTCLEGEMSIDEMLMSENQHDWIDDLVISTNKEIHNIDQEENSRKGFEYMGSDLGISVEDDFRVIEYTGEIDGKAYKKTVCDGFIEEELEAYISADIYSRDNNGVWDFFAVKLHFSPINQEDYIPDSIPIETIADFTYTAYGNEQLIYRLCTNMWSSAPQEDGQYSDSMEYCFETDWWTAIYNIAISHS